MCRVSHQTIEDAHRFGISVKMITGDHLLIARETARQLSLGTHVVDSQLLPVLDPLTSDLPSDLVAHYGTFILGTDAFAQGENIF